MAIPSSHVRQFLGFLDAGITPPQMSLAGRHVGISCIDSTFSSATRAEAQRFGIHDILLTATTLL